MCLSVEQNPPLRLIHNDFSIYSFVPNVSKAVNYDKSVL